MTLTELKALIDRTNDVMEPADVDLGDMSDQSRTYLEYLENEVCQYRTALPNALALIEVMKGALEYCHDKEKRNYCPESSSYTLSDTTAKKALAALDHADHIHQAALAEIAELRGLFEVMTTDIRRAQVNIGAQIDTLTETQKELAINQAWHILAKALTAYQAYKEKME